MESIETTITAVEHKLGSDWYSVITSEPKLRLDTKKEDLATRALGLKGKPVRIQFNPKQVEKNGNVYTNRYFEGVEELTPEPATSSFDQPTQSARAPLSSEERWSIALSVGIKAAIATLPYFPEDKRTFDLQQQVALGWARFLYFSSPPKEEMAAVLPFAGSSPGAYSDPGSDAPPPSDDDIPY